MKLMVELISVLGMLGGIVFLVLAVTTPGKYMLSGASAPQMTQMYSEGIFYALLAIGLLLLGVYLQNASRGD